MHALLISPRFPRPAAAMARLPSMWGSRPTGGLVGGFFFLPLTVVLRPEAFMLCLCCAFPPFLAVAVSHQLAPCQAVAPLCGMDQPSAMGQ